MNYCIFDDCVSYLLINHLSQLKLIFAVVLLCSRIAL